MDHNETTGQFTTHIVKWSDGEHNWSMVIKPGKVDMFTTAPISETTLRSHADAWGEAFAFVNQSFARKIDEAQ